MTIVRRLAFLVLLCGPFWIQAQPGNPEEDPDAVPITGLEYLLVVGGAYGVSRILKNRKGKPDDEQ